MSIIDTSSPFPRGTGGTLPFGRINWPYAPYVDEPNRVTPPNTAFVHYTNPYRLTEEDVNRIAARVVELITEQFTVTPIRADDV